MKKFLCKSQAPMLQHDKGWLVLVESNTTGTGRLFARRAAECGYRPVVLAEKPGRYPYLEQDHVRCVQCDTSSRVALQDSLETLAAETHISGIFSSSEYFIEMAASLARTRGLPSASSESLKTCRNKWTQRCALQSAGVITPRFKLAVSVDATVAALAEIPLPVIVKPVFGSGSVGVKLCSTLEETAGHASLLLSRTSNERGMPLPAEVLVEEYVVGDEFSVETLGGMIVGITRKHISREPFFVETGHDFPAELCSDVHSSIARTVRKALEAIGLLWGPAHVELRLSSAGPVIIEINPRLAGGFIPEIVRLAVGIDMISETVMLAVGSALRARRTGSHHASIRFVCPARPGVIKKFVGFEDAWKVEGVVDIEGYRQPGDSVRIEHDFRDRIGHVIARGATEHQAAQLAEAAWKKISVEIEPQ